MVLDYKTKNEIKKKALDTISKIYRNGSFGHNEFLNLLMDEIIDETQAKLKG